MDLVALAVNAALVILVILVLGRRPAKRFARRAWKGTEGDRGLLASLVHAAAGAASSLPNVRRVPVTLDVPRCSNCGRLVRDSSVFCRACGTPLQPESVQADIPAPVAGVEATAPVLAEAAPAPLIAASPAPQAEAAPAPLPAGRPRCLHCGRYVRRSSDVCKACGTPRQPDPIRYESVAPVTEGVASILAVANRVPTASGRPRCLHCGRYVRPSSDVCKACGTPRQPDSPGRS
jgi:predicted amidophosphoribosyltransferase